MFSYCLVQESTKIDPILSLAAVAACQHLAQEQTNHPRRHVDKKYDTRPVLVHKSTKMNQILFIAAVCVDNSSQ